ncbi:MAG: ABC transporter permease [Lachnospiraceae bacterium]|nr:ABC transporter permease [Lachnospiraceae bacterium]
MVIKMKKVLSAYNQFMKEIWRDYMMSVCLFVPVLMGVLFRFGIPVLDKVLCSKLGFTTLLVPYYAIFDLLLASMTPMMFAFAGVMVMLEEFDNGIARFLIVTPLGKSGYLMSRLGLSMILSAIYDMVLLYVCSLTKLSSILVISISILSSFMGLIVSLLVVGFAHNKVEGMALTKLSGFSIFGLLAAFFIQKPIGVVAGILPTYWIMKMQMSNQNIYIVPAIVMELAWITVLYKKFQKKLEL